MDEKCFHGLGGCYGFMLAAWRHTTLLSESLYYSCRVPWYFLAWLSQTAQRSVRFLGARNTCTVVFTWLIAVGRPTAEMHKLHCAGNRDLGLFLLSSTRTFSWSQRHECTSSTMTHSAQQIGVGGCFSALVFSCVGNERQRHDCKPPTIAHSVQELGSWDCFSSFRTVFFLGRSVVYACISLGQQVWNRWLAGDCICW